MILVDPRDGRSDQDVSGKCVSNIRQLGVMSDKNRLEFGDFAFEGRGPEGYMQVGVERKTLTDMLNCIDDSRYNMQRLGMKEMYAKSFLNIEGVWKRSKDGFLLQGTDNGNWYFIKPSGRPVEFSKLFRYLISVAHSGVIITYSRDLLGTCQNVVEIFHYHQKKWSDHKSLLEKQMLNIPTLGGYPTLVRRWAAELEGIGVTYSAAAERLFKRPLKLATAEEMDWLKIDGIGPATARNIIKEIQGYNS